MIDITECLSTKSKITKLQKLNNDLIAIATQTEGIKIFSNHDCDAKVTISSKHLNEETSTVCFSYDSKLLAFANHNLIYVIDIKTHKLINSIKLSKENAQIITFSLDSHYIIVGTSQGRVLQYKYDSDLLISRLCSFPHNKAINSIIKNNFVSTFSLYKNRLAVSGYGASIYILDLYSSANRGLIVDKASTIDALSFIDNETLASGNNKGIVNIISLKNNTITKQIVTPFSKIKQITLMPNPNFIMISAQTNYTAVIDITTSKIIHNKYITLKDKIENILLLNDNSLVISLNNSKILKAQLPNILKLNFFIKNDDFYKAYKLIEKEPMIRDSQEHKNLETLYRKNYDLAIKALIIHNKPLAVNLMQKFNKVSSKEEEIYLLFKAFENYDKFKKLFLEKKYPLVYAMSSKYPALEFTNEYQKTQDIWKKIFMQAQKEILLGKLSNAQELLAPYITVASKNTTIKLILNNNKEFLEFLKAIEKKDFNNVFKLVKQNKNFSQIPSFTSLNQDLEESLLKIQEYINKGDTHKANESLEKIGDIFYINEKLKKLRHDCQEMQKLQKEYENKNLLVCYNMIDLNINLLNTKLGKLLEEQWSQMINICEKFALDGNILDIKNTLGELINIPSRTDKIGDLLRVSFHKRIKIFMDENLFEDGQNIIYSYIEIFGLDKEINSIIKEFEQLTNKKVNISFLQSQRHPRNSWLSSKNF